MAISEVSYPSADYYRSIVYIVSTFPNGAQFAASGVMVGPNDVLTASHVLYIASQGGQATSVTVTPAYDPSPYSTPYGQLTSSTFNYFTNYDLTGNFSLLPGDYNANTMNWSEVDIGLISLSSDVGNQTGWMTLDPSFVDGYVNITGFPSTYGNTMMNSTAYAYDYSSDHTIFYGGAELYPGNSGGPVWSLQPDGAHVYGVVSTGQWGPNSAGTYSQLTQWISSNDYMIQPAAPQPAPTPSPEPSTPPVTVSVLDHAHSLFDMSGDGRADIMTRSLTSGVTYLNGETTGMYGGLDWKIVSTGDYNGDSRGDLFWQNDNGATAIWTMNGPSVMNSGYVYGASTPNASVIGSGDLNGDGRSDVLWRGSDGSLSAWVMNDHQVISTATIGVADSSQKMVGSADFNGDNRDDILWRNDDGSVSMWLMDGSSHTGGSSFGNPSNFWHVAGVGDFNGDGNADIFWRDDTGSTGMWNMRGESIVGGWGTYVGHESLDWKVGGVGDFNGDHKSDVLWQNTDGSMKVDIMDGLNIISTVMQPTLPSDWVIS